MKSFITKFALVCLFALPVLCHAQNLVNCAPLTPCSSTSGPGNTGTGYPLWQSFGIVNGNFTALAPWFAMDTIPPHTIPGNNTGSQAAPTALTSPTVSGTMTALGGFVGTYSLSPSIVSPSAAPGPTNTWMYVGGTSKLSGTQTYASGFTPIYANISDLLNSNGASQADGLSYWGENLQNGWAGGRNLNQFALAISSAPVSLGTGDYVANQNQISANASLGGLDLNLTDAVGTPFSSADKITSTAAFANGYGADSRESDVGLTANVVARRGQTQVLLTQSEGVGTVVDCAYCIEAQPAAAGLWSTGLAFGTAIGPSPFSSTSTLIKVEEQWSGAPTQALAYGIGIDARKANFATAENMWVGSMRDGAGNGYDKSLTLLNGITQKSASIASITIGTDAAGITGGSYFNSASFPGINIQASNGGGTNASATVATMDLTKALILTGGTGGTNGDTLTLAGNTGTEPTLTLNISSFTGVITCTGVGDGSHCDTLTVSGVTGAGVAAGMLLTDGGVNVPSGTYVIAGSGSTWTLNQSIANVSSEAMTGTGVTIASPGSVTVKVANPTTTGGTSSVQPTFRFGFGIATITVGTAGTLYTCNPPPSVTTPSQNQGRTTIAVLTAVMSCATGAYAIDASGNISGNSLNSTPVGNTTPSSGAFTTLSSTSAASVNGISAPYNLAQWGVQLVLPGASSMTIGTTGAFTLTTALPNSLVCSNGCGMYFSANAFTASSAAGVYWVVCSTTTACQGYNNLLSGVPAPVASPTSWGTIAGSTYTSPTGALVALATISEPGGAMGPDGDTVVDFGVSRISNTDSTLISLLYGGQTIGVNTLASTQWMGFHRTIHNMGSNSAQVVMNNSANQSTDQTTLNQTSSFSSVASGSAQNILIEAELNSAATDWVIVNGGTIRIDHAN